LIHKTYGFIAATPQRVEFAAQELLLLVLRAVVLGALFLLEELPDVELFTLLLPLFLNDPGFLFDDLEPLGELLSLQSDRQFALWR
jgi:hypothetical protein